MSFVRGIAAARTVLEGSSILQATSRGVWVCGLTLLLSIGAVPARGNAAPPISEVQGRAHFVFNFVKYVEWPEHAFADAGTPIIIGVVADQDFTEILRQTVAGKSVSGRPVEVKVFAPGADPLGCHLLFIGRDSQPHAAALLRKTAGRPVLTVGESDRFLANGGMFCLVKKENKLRPQVVLPAVERVGLRVSSKLLGVSEVLRTKPE